MTDADLSPENRAIKQDAVAMEADFAALIERLRSADDVDMRKVSMSASSGMAAFALIVAAIGGDTVTF